MAKEQAKGFPGGGFGLLRLFGIEIRIDYSWFIIFGLVLYTLSALFFPRQFPGQSTATYWAMGAVSALLLFASVLIHELSHSLVARSEGLPVPRITLFIFGGMAHMVREPKGPKPEFRIAAVGPVTSIALGILFWGLHRATEAWLAADWAGIVSQTFRYLGFINVALAVFNMVPGFPLDGGRVLRAILWHRWNDIRRATRVVARIGRGFGTVLIIFGVLQIFAPGGLIGGLWLVFIGLFLRQAAQSSYQMTALQEMLKDVSVSEVMRDNPVTVAEDTPLDRLVSDYFYRHHYASFPVVSGDRLVGLVHINEVKKVPRDRWEQTAVREVMSPEEEVGTAGPSDDVFQVLRRMTQSGKQKIPVVKDGQLVGMLTARDILEMFRVKSDLAD